MTAGETIADAAAAEAWRGVCYHEAGHIVLGVVYNLPARRVVAWPALAAFASFAPADAEPESIGAAIVRLSLDDVTRRPITIPAGWDLAAFLVMVLGGEVAASRVSGRRAEAWEDRYIAEHLLGAALGRAPWGKETQHVLAGIVRATEAACRQHWDWISRTAEALLADKVLTADQVRALRQADGGRR